MAVARDPNKLEPAYLITLAVIIVFPFCCSYLGGNSAAPPKMAVPEQGSWTVKMDDSKGGRIGGKVAIYNGKWRVEMSNPDNNQQLIVVHDGQRSVSNHPEFQPSQLEMLNPLKQMQVIAQAYNRHPKPESESLDGVLCWHAKVREGDDEAETWLDAKTGFPKKFTTTRGSVRTITQDFEGFSPNAHSDSRIFDANVLEPLLKP